MLHTTTSISIAGKQFNQFHSLMLVQQLDQHHFFELKIGNDWLQQSGSSVVAASKSFLGKEVNITIQPFESIQHYDPLIFNGVVMSVSAGKESDGTHGFCIIRGYSPTILLDNDLHIQSFENQDLSAIVNASLKAGGPYISKSSVDPLTKGPQKYVVQYKESTFDFLQRMSQRFGEWFFYNGQQVIFGNYQPKEASLVHLVDMMSFDIEMKVQPNNQQMHGFDYRNNKAVEDSTTSQSAGKVNDYTQHVEGISEKMFSKPSQYKMLHPFTSNAKSELDTLLRRQKKGRMGDMVQLSGSSKHTALRVGDHVSIKESVYSHDDHGKFMIWGLTHHVTGNGDYYNDFQGVPAEGAAPQAHLGKIPFSEAQSAVVVDNNDPKDLGRVKARFRWQQQGTTPWMRLVSPHGGGNKGVYMIPEKGEEVIVDFEGGNPELPFVLGTTYNGEAKAGFGTAGNDKKVIKTRSGITILMDDSDGSITISDKSGSSIKMDGKDNISISSKTKIDITSKEVNISSETFSVSASKDGGVMAKSLVMLGKEDAALTSKKTLVNGGETLDLTSKAFSANGTNTTKISGGTSTNIDGGTIGMNGTGDVTVSGGLVKINS
ncbi:MAG TPA: phage baseplate assembly protein V [Chitinophaga sp.]|uniref:type VI secretion system Vgr family protein n=1 Tax=Chitinophaga sp. TaxID=1869181 RepID=UPI002B5DED98|nr:phage baseplate assembly protein V [Chitinophaga sp.]HVI47539.1 phage baseplate assembly protein V [Chitinophaga sp.]